jgi:hypothetical protein
MTVTTVTDKDVVDAAAADLPVVAGPQRIALKDARSLSAWNGAWPCQDFREVGSATVRR